jgi:hypothetical protein
MSTDPTTIAPGAALDADQGGGPPTGQPWTLVVEAERWSADLEHAAPLPRVGERIEYIAEDGGRSASATWSTRSSRQPASARESVTRTPRRTPS